MDAVAAVGFSNESSRRSSLADKIVVVEFPKEGPTKSVCGVQL